MKKIEKDVSTSKEAKKAGLKRIERRHIVKKGETDLADCKVRITINLDADILEYFKDRAGGRDAAPYQTQINNALRRVMMNEPASVSSTAKELLQNEGFIEALRDKLKAA